MGEINNLRPRRGRARTAPRGDRKRKGWLSRAFLWMTIQQSFAVLCSSTSAYVMPGEARAAAPVAGAARRRSEWANVGNVPPRARARAAPTALRREARRPRAEPSARRGAPRLFGAAPVISPPLEEKVRSFSESLPGAPAPGPLE